MARQIAIDVGVLAPCQNCGEIRRTEVGEKAAYKRGSLLFTQKRLGDIFNDRRQMTDAIKFAIDAAEGCDCDAHARKPDPRASIRGATATHQLRAALRSSTQQAPGAVPETKQATQSPTTVKETGADGAGDKLAEAGLGLLLDAALPGSSIALDVISGLDTGQTPASSAQPPTAIPNMPPPQPSQQRPDNFWEGDDEEGRGGSGDREPGD